MTDEITLRVTFSIIIYFILMLLISFVFRNKSKVKDRILGNRSFNTIQTAMSVAAADTSSWVMIALPASVYSSGLNQSFIPFGLIIGSYLTWKFIAPKLREKTENYSAFTIPSYLSLCSNNTKYNIEKLSSRIILIFLVVYISSGMRSAGILIQSFTSIKYIHSIIIICIFVSFYTITGGIKGMSWGDVFQTMLIIVSLIFLPISMYKEYTINFVNNSDVSLLQELKCVLKTPPLTIISSLAWGLGYFGEPHILSKFMSSKSVVHIKKASKICILWTITAFFCAILIGFFGKKLFILSNPENLFFTAVFHYYDNYLIGLFFSAVIAAILSTICSQLVVCSGILVKNVFTFTKVQDDMQNKKKQFSSTLNLFSLIIVLIISAFIASDETNTVMKTVKYAWGGLGASFGPAIIYSLYCKAPQNSAIFYGILFGFITMILFVLLRDYVLFIDIYEIIPAFIISSLVIFFQNNRKEKI